MVPTLALGIPGSATAAVILGGLQVQGLRPGPYLFEEQPGSIVCNFLCHASCKYSFSIYRTIGSEDFF